ncbi:hypothetical protein ABIB34_003697 [Rhodococcus sp. UYP5]
MGMSPAETLGGRRSRGLPVFFAGLDGMVRAGGGYGYISVSHTGYVSDEFGTVSTFGVSPANGAIMF